MPKPFLVPDGYTRHVGFNATEEFDAFDFEFRPVRGLDRSTLTRSCYLTENKELREAAWFAFLADHVLSWSVSEDFENDVKRAECEMINILTNTISGDLTPDWENIDGVRVELDPELAKTDEDDRGNSDRG